MGAARPPHTIPNNRELSSLTDDQLFEWWRKIARDKFSAEQAQEIFQLHKSMLRIDIDIYESARNLTLGWQKTPAMLVLGKNDHICPLEYGDQWLDIMPNLRIKSCPGSHLFLLESPKEYAKLITEFVTVETRTVHIYTKPFSISANVLDLKTRNGNSRRISALYQTEDLETSKQLETLYNFRENLSQFLSKDGAVLLRGFASVGTPEHFYKVLDSLGIAPTPYVGGNSPRSKLYKNIYTSTEYAASEKIWPHCELSYMSTWPTKILFLLYFNHLIKVVQQFLFIWTRY